MTLLLTPAPTKHDLFLFSKQHSKVIQFNQNLESTAKFLLLLNRILNFSKKVIVIILYIEIIVLHIELETEKIIFQTVQHAK
jgi:hypothetical protein